MAGRISDSEASQQCRKRELKSSEPPGSLFWKEGSERKNKQRLQVLHTKKLSLLLLLCF